MNCFYHPEQSAVGICAQCGKGACRRCIEDIGGALLCADCMSLQHQQADLEEHAVEMESQAIIQNAKTRIRWSWVIAGCSALFALLSGFSNGLSSAPANSSNSPSVVSLILSVVLGSLLTGYLFWSMYWGIPPVWVWWRGFIGKLGCFIIANPLTWLIIIMFLFWIPVMFGIYYGIFGGAIYQHLKYRRIAGYASGGDNKIIAIACVALIACALVFFGAIASHRPKGIKSTLGDVKPNTSPQAVTDATPKRELRQPKLSSLDSSDARYRVNSCGSITDVKTGLEWYIGPDQNVTQYEATNWVLGLSVCNGGWRMPTVSELQTLYDSSFTAGTGYYTHGRYWPAHIHPVFNGIGGGSWVWANDSSNDQNARSFNFNQGKAVSIAKTNTTYSTRVFAVR